MLPEAYRKTVIKMNGDVAQTFLVDGVVAGIWRVDDGRVVLEPFEPLSAAARREIEDGQGVWRRSSPSLVALGEQLLPARDLDPLAVLDVMRCRAGSYAAPAHVHHLAWASVRNDA